jgi:chitinase
VDNAGMRPVRSWLRTRLHGRRPAAPRLTRAIALVSSGLAIGLAGCAVPPGGELASSINQPLRRSMPTRGTAPHFDYSPYKYIPVALAPDSGAISTAVAGAPTPIVVNGQSTLPPGVTALTLAFATGECGAETWDGMDPRLLVDGNLRAFVRAGIDYIISTGGEGGVFTCATDAGMEAFIAHYASPGLVGFDFDIERGQTADVVASLVRRVKAAKERHPELRFSFTLATWGASDGSQASLNDDGQRVMQAIRDAGLADYYINLMVMDYGEATPRNCVVSGGVCDMGQSAIQAAQNLNTRFGVPMSRIELTPMLGVNDVVANVFTLDDARVLARFARESAMGGLHFWSLDRDAPCPPGVSGVSAICSGLHGMPGFAFTHAFRNGLQ